jgi:hypothetical protein
MIFSAGKLESGLIVVVRFESKNFPDEVELVVS